jgi:hypothetical protein
MKKLKKWPRSNKGLWSDRSISLFYRTLFIHVPLFSTSALDGFEWPASQPGSFTHGERLPAPEPVWMLWSREESVYTLRN